MPADDVTPARYALMLPPGWRRIPVRLGSAAAIERMLDEQLAHRGRDEVQPLRRALAEDLRSVVTDAARAGGIDLYLAVRSSGELPVDASLLVSLVPPVDGRPVSLGELVPELVADGEAETVVLRLAGEALRLRTTRTPHDEDALPVDRPVTRVHYLVPVPGPEQVRLLLTFATSTAPVADQLVALFDAMAGTLGFTDRRPPRG